jgi:hypothetical protein
VSIHIHVAYYICKFEVHESWTFDFISEFVFQGFTEIDAASHLGIKEMGKLSEKFLDACAMKLPRSQSGAKASELYNLWLELLNNPEWKPFKTVTVDGNLQVKLFFREIRITLWHLEACILSFYEVNRACVNLYVTRRRS